MGYVVTYGQDYMFSRQIHELLKVEVVVQILIDGLQFLQCITVRVATEVLDGHFTAYINFKNTKDKKLCSCVYVQHYLLNVCGEPKQIS